MLGGLNFGRIRDVLNDSAWKRNEFTHQSPQRERGLSSRFAETSGVHQCQNRNYPHTAETRVAPDVPCSGSRPPR